MSVSVLLTFFFFSLFLGLFFDSLSTFSVSAILWTNEAVSRGLPVLAISCSCVSAFS